jgi:hypothetical protein
MLSIESITANYIVSRDHPWPDKIRARLDEIVLRELPLALAEIFGGESAQGDGMWFIRDLDIALDVNSDWDDGRIAQCWAEGIAHSFCKATAGGESGAVFFPDRAAYLACFLTHLTDGRALQQWFFQPFSGLSALPASAAIRTAIEEDSDTGWTALIRMKPDDLEKALAVLSEADSRRILMLFGGRTVFPADSSTSTLKEGGPVLSAGERFASSNRDALALLWKTWGAPLRSLSEAGEALFHYLAATRNASGAAGMAAARCAIALTRLARRSRGETAGGLLAALAGGDIATLCTIAGANDAEALRPLLDAPPEWIWEVGRALATPLRTDTPSGKTGSGAAIRFTPFGGSFLLLPFLNSLPVSGADPGRPAVNGLAPEATVRFLILIKCLGRDRSEAAFDDPLLRDLFHIPPDFSARDAITRIRSFTQRQISTFHQRILEWQTVNGLAESRALILEPLVDSSLAILLDPSTAAWRWLGEKNRRGLIRLKSLIHKGSTLLCRDDDLCHTVRREIPDCSAQALEECKSEDGELSTRLDRLPEDEAYLRSHLDSSPSNACDQVLAVAAQNVVRAFALRLPGFSRSGTGYLYRNFLDLIASVEDEPDRRVVRLGKPPLNLVLAMAGQNRQSYRADWLNDRPFELYPQE